MFWFLFLLEALDSTYNLPLLSFVLRVFASIWIDVLTPDACCSERGLKRLFSRLIFVYQTTLRELQLADLLTPDACCSERGLKGLFSRLIFVYQSSLRELQLADLLTPNACCSERGLKRLFSRLIFVYQTSLRELQLANLCDGFSWHVCWGNPWEAELKSPLILK